MQRTQIYLTDQEVSGIKALAANTGKSQSELIREAIDVFLNKDVADNRLAMMRKARGIWKDRDDLPDLEQLRKESDRFGDIPL